MHVVATAGHVDHGKSTLVRALTGMEPDRWSEELRRGMTIDLGYAWTTLPDGQTIAFVDVPGHERFIGNMLAGIGPVGAVMFVVAADEGWKEQSAEHLLAVDALGMTSGLLVVTRSDLADPLPAVNAARSEIAGSSLGGVPVVCVSGRTGAGLPALRTALSVLVDSLPRPAAEGRVRLWIDRSFSIRGSGTVVTGTLEAGALSVGDQLELMTRDSGVRKVRVRGLQTLGRANERVEPVARVAVNLRNIAAQDIRRGDLLLTPESWRLSTVIEARTADDCPLPPEVTLHVGTAGVPARVRPLGPTALRLTLRSALPLQPGDRALLQDQTTRRILTGVSIVDVAPPELRRRGAAAGRARELAEPGLVDDTLVRGRATLAREGAILATDLAQRGETVATADAVAVGAWLVGEPQLERWATALRSACEEQQRRDRLRPGVTSAAAIRSVGLPDAALLPLVVRTASLTMSGGSVLIPGAAPDLGPAEEGLRALEARLRAAPFDAPDRPLLEQLALGGKELSTAAALGRIVRLGPEVVLLPEAPSLAVRVLAALPQPFTTSEARIAWHTTRRVAIPLLEHLDHRGWTRRITADQREVVRGSNRSS